MSRAGLIHSLLNGEILIFKNVVMKKFFIQASGVLAVGAVVFAIGLILIGDRSIVIQDQNPSEVLAEFTEQQEKLNVILEINGSTRSSYTTGFIDGDTIFEFLKRYDLESEDFSFEYDSFEGLGEYVTSLNGETANPEREFWSLEVNEKESQVGISDYDLIEGDKITFTLINF